MLEKKAAVIFNKADLIDESLEEEICSAFDAALQDAERGRISGVYMVSAATGQGIDGLRASLFRMVLG
jgi:selenocysteine-specific translation elongation factor